MWQPQAQKKRPNTAVTTQQEHEEEERRGDNAFGNEPPRIAELNRRQRGAGKTPVDDVRRDEDVHQHQRRDPPACRP